MDLPTQVKTLQAERNGLLEWREQAESELAAAYQSNARLQKRLDRAEKLIEGIRQTIIDMQMGSKQNSPWCVMQIGRLIQEYDRARS